MSTKRKRLTIGITGLNAHDNPGPGIAVIRALRDHFPEVDIIGLAYEPLEPGIYMDKMVNKTYNIPYPTDGSTALLQRIDWIHEQVGFDMIIPNFDAELHNFIKIAPHLADSGIKTYLPTHDQLSARDKINLSEFAKKNNFNVPACHLLNSANDIPDAAEKLEYPMVIKGKFYEARIVSNKDAAQKAFYDLSAKWGLPVIAQQYIKGIEINVAGLADGKGNTVSVIPMRKMYITDKGKAWAGITIEDAELIQLAERFATTIKWKGGFELEIMKDHEGNLYIMEINPRFPAWVYLTAAAGQNQPAALVRMAMGEDVAPFTDYISGKMFIRYSWDEVVDINKFQQFSAFGVFTN